MENYVSLARKKFFNRTVVGFILKNAFENQFTAKADLNVSAKAIAVLRSNAP
jgi:hypothetical protein